jgi:hypothetical protein
MDGGNKFIIISNGVARAIQAFLLIISDLSNYIEVAALSVCWWYFGKKHARFTVESGLHNALPLSQLYIWVESMHKIPSLSKIQFSFICTWFQVNRTTNKRDVCKNRVSKLRTCPIAHTEYILHTP